MLFSHFDIFKALEHQSPHYNEFALTHRVHFLDVMSMSRFCTSLSKLLNKLILELVRIVIA